MDNCPLGLATIGGAGKLERPETYRDTISSRAFVNAANPAIFVSEGNCVSAIDITV